MGRLVTIKCDCGFECNNLYYGMNAAAYDIEKHQTLLIKSGKYGLTHRNYLLSDSALRMITISFESESDRKTNITCPKCGNNAAAILSGFFD